MTADHTLKTSSFGDAECVDVIAGSKKCRAEDIPGLHFLGKIAELTNSLHCLAIMLLDVAEQRLGQAVLLLIVEAKLNGVVAVALLRLALQNAVRSGEHNSGRRHHAF